MKYGILLVVIVLAYALTGASLLHVGIVIGLIALMTFLTKMANKGSL